MLASAETLMLVTSGLVGLTVLSLGWIVLSFSGSLFAAAASREGYEQLRRQRLRSGNWIFRYFESLVDNLAGKIHANDEAAKAQASARRDAEPTPLDRVQQWLVTAGEKLPWLPEEHMAARRIEGYIVGLLLILVGWQFFDSLAAATIFGVFARFAYPELAIWSLQGRADRRRRTFLERLPFTLDLMALMMEAGGNFPECLAAAVNENQDHPLGEEFGEVLRETNLGRTRKEALEGLKQRMQDDDVSELTFALIKGDELGTPLAQTLRTQASLMLVKRSQTVEKESAEAQVMIVFPGMVIMLACLLIIIAPFILQAIYIP